MNATILLIEDNEHYLEINREVLTDEGYRVLEAATIAKGREMMKSERPNLIVLDVMLPDGNGLELCEELRRESNIPILFLSAKKTGDDRLAGFKAGGCGYMTKPYSLDILVENVNALLGLYMDVPDTITKGRLSLDVAAGIAKLDGIDLLLAKKEFALLLVFIKNEKRHISGEYLYEKIWNAPMGEDSTAFKNTVKRLRAKIAGSGFRISWSRSEGYVFTNE